MAHFLPVVHSTLEAGALVAALWPEYPLANPTDCHLIQCGFNDHHFISTDGFFDRGLAVLRERISEHLPQLDVD